MRRLRASFCATVGIVSLVALPLAAADTGCALLDERGVDGKRWVMTFCGETQAWAVDSIRGSRVGTRTYSLWLKSHLSKPDTVAGRTFDNMLQRMELDCRTASEPRYRYGVSVYYSGGTHVYEEGSGGKFTDWNDVLPGTAGEWAFSEMCKWLPDVYPEPKK